MSSYFLSSLLSHEQREIDNHYHIQLAAEHASQIENYQRDLYESQLESAKENYEQLRQIESEMGDIKEGLDKLNSGTLYVAAILKQGFVEIGSQLMQHQQTLDKISAILQSPYETKALELRKQANRWLTNGAKCDGRDRIESFNDAMMLLRTTIDNPIGKQDYVAWFQIGWLLWKHENKIEEAEVAFYRAQRLSAPDNNLWYIDSLRHLAMMQYRLGKYEDAYITISKALSNKDHETLFDAARYAAKLGRAEHIGYLDQCITLRPTTINTMFAEPDLISNKYDLVALAENRLRKGREDALKAIQSWQRTLREISQVEGMARVTIKLPPVLTDGATEMKNEVQRGNYLISVALMQMAAEKIKNALILAHAVIDAERRRLSQYKEGKKSEYWAAIDQIPNLEGLIKCENDKKRTGPKRETSYIGCTTFIIALVGGVVGRVVGAIWVQTHNLGGGGAIFFFPGNAEASTILDRSSFLGFFLLAIGFTLLVDFDKKKAIAKYVKECDERILELRTELARHLRTKATCEEAFKGIEEASHILDRATSNLAGC